MRVSTLPTSIFLVPSTSAILGAITLFIAVSKIDFILKVNINLLPIQFISLGLCCFLLLKVLRVDRPFFFLVASSATLLILVYNLRQPFHIITNPLLPSLLLMIFLSSFALNVRKLESLKFVIISVVGINLSIHLVQNLLFSPEQFGNGRMKGLGSGTSYAILACYILFFLIDEYRFKAMSLAWCLVLSVVPLSSILLTQSRGAFLSLLIILTLKSISSAKNFFIILVLLGVSIFAMSEMESLITAVDLLSRIDFRRFDNLDQFTSGRLLTQEYILQWAFSGIGTMQILFGDSGLNGFKQLISDGLEYPHFDLLYFLYDTGSIGAMVYVGSAIMILCRYRWDKYLLLFFLSSLHTNMVLSPGILMFSVFLAILNEKNKIPK